MSGESKCETPIVTLVRLSLTSTFFLTIPIAAEAPEPLDGTAKLASHWHLLDTFYDDDFLRFIFLAVQDAEEQFSPLYPRSTLSVVPKASVSTTCFYADASEHSQI